MENNINVKIHKQRFAYWQKPYYCNECKNSFTNWQFKRTYTDKKSIQMKNATNVKKAF